MKKTTAQEFSQFRFECKRLELVLGFASWDITYQHKILTGENADAIALCESDYDARTCAISFNLKRITTKEYNPLQMAKHEMAHLLLAGMSAIGGDRFCTLKSLNAEEEKVTTVLERII